MKDLTDLQETVLRFILTFQEQNGRTPNGPEIAEELDYKDPSSAYQHLRALDKKGFLDVIQPKTRSTLRIKATKKARQLLSEEWPVFGAIPAGPVTDVPADDTVSVRSIQDLLPMIQPDDYFLTVSGDSMKNAGLEEGMTLLMRPTDDPTSDVSAGDVCAVWVDGDGGTLKRVYFENGHVRLVPENEEYEERVEPAERVRIQGVLVAALSVIPFRNGG